MPYYKADWIVKERNRLSKGYLMALFEASLHEEQNKNFELAIRLAEIIVKINPLNEDGHHLLLRLYISAGEKEKAIAHIHLMNEYFATKNRKISDTNLSMLIHDISRLFIPVVVFNAINNRVSSVTDTSNNIDDICSSVVGSLNKIMNENESLRWLNTSNELFGGLSPRQMIRNGKLEQVLDLIAMVEHGIHS